MIPLPLILIFIFVLLIRLTINNAKIKTDPRKHDIIRVSVLLVAIPLITLICYLIDQDQGLLGAFYLSYYFTGVWLLYLLVEAISLYIAKQNELASTSLFLFFISAVVIGLGTYALFNAIN